MEQKKTLGQLFVPICLETLCYMLSGMVDTLMLSSVGDAAVGAVGTANTYIGIFIIMFSVISAGMIAVMTQYIGAGREGIAYQARQLGMLFNAIVGAILAVFLFFQSGMILSAVGVADSLMEYAKTYLRIVGGRMHFKRTDSDFLQLLKSVWIYQTASCGNGICQHFKFYLKCSIPFWVPLWSSRSCCSNSNFKGIESWPGNLLRTLLYSCEGEEGEA